jgi:hypothetical protein
MIKGGQLLWDGVDHEDGPRNRHNVNELSIHIVYATKQSERWTIHIGLCGGSSSLSHPVFNFRGEYDKLDGCDAGGGEIRDTGIINVGGGCGWTREARWTAGGRCMGDGTKDAWKGPR